jgi:hypothetical protein
LDNLTHTLIGLIAGESVARTTRAREPGLAPDTRRGLFVAIGGNLPDLDLDFLNSYGVRAGHRSRTAKLINLAFGER